MPDADQPKPNSALVRHVVLVELAGKPGLQQVSLDPKGLAEKSAKALDEAMETIQSMAVRVVDTLSPLEKKPKKIELAFGLKLNVEGNALVTKAGVEATINVTMTWEG